MTIKPKRRWFQFSLRALLIGITVGSVALGWYMYRWRRQQAEQRKAAAAVKELGGGTGFILSKGDSTSFVNAIFESNKAENSFFLHDKHIQDDDLKIFATAEATKDLDLGYNEITDNGLVHLRNLRQLRFLDLKNNKRISDEGLKQLENLQDLEQLNLIGTKVTAAGVKELQQKLPSTLIAY